MAFNPVKTGIFFSYDLFFDEIPAYAGMTVLGNDVITGMTNLQEFSFQKLL